jgi:hypothetical protein
MQSSGNPMRPRFDIKIDEVLKSESNCGSSKSDQEARPGLLANCNHWLVLDSVDPANAGTQSIAATIGNHL